MNAHIHAENMQLYAEDAAKTAKPWELWEFISFGMEDWQTLDSNPNWGFATEYRRKVKEADPQADTQTAALLERIDRLAEAGVCQMTTGGKHAFLKDIRAAIAAAKENK